MTKVEDCTWEVETAASDMSSAESGTRYENARKRLVESIKDLIQAVRDEEFEKARDSVGDANGKCAAESCAQCKAFGTRYCP